MHLLLLTYKNTPIETCIRFSEFSMNTNAKETSLNSANCTNLKLSYPRNVFVRESYQLYLEEAENITLSKIKRAFRRFSTNRLI